MAAVAEEGLEVGACGAERDAGVSDFHDLGGELVGALRVWRGESNGAAQECQHLIPMGWGEDKGGKRDYAVITAYRERAREQAGGIRGNLGR